MTKDKLSFAKRTRLVLAVALGIVGLLAWACGDDPDPTPVPGDEPIAVAGSPTVVGEPPESLATAIPAPPLVRPTTVPPAPQTAVTPAPTSTGIPESPPTLAPTVTPPPANGTLDIRVTDQPARDVTAIVVTATLVEVNKVDGEDASGWIAIVEREISFDLLKVAGIEEILGTAELEPGKYVHARSRRLGDSDFERHRGRGHGPQRHHQARSTDRD